MARLVSVICKIRLSGFASTGQAHWFNAKIGDVLERLACHQIG